MTDADETNETQELDVLLVSETDVHAEEREFALAFEDIPPSLMSYVEASKSRATVCEKLILQEVEDFTTSCEDLMNFTELSKITMELNEQDISETENDSCLETEAPDTVAASPRNEDETAADNNGEHLIFASRILQISLTKEEIKEINEQQQTPKEKRYFEELKKEEQIRQRENDFQVELKKLMEAEKLQQMELQLMEKRAQEKLEQELLLQQELISNLQKQVKKERRMMTEELKRMKEEEDKKKIEEEKIKRENMAEEMKRKKEEELSTKEEEERKTKIEEEKNKEEVKCNKKIWLKREDKMSQMERETERETENTSNEKRHEEEEGKTVVKVTGRNIEGTKKKHDDIRHMEEWKIEAEVTEELEARTQDEKKTEKERRDDKKMRDEQMGKTEEGKRRILDGRQNNVIRKEEEKIKQEEWNKKQEENSNYRNMEEEIRPEEDDKAKIRKVEDGRTVMEGESREQEQKTLDKGDEGQMKEEVSENPKAEEQWPKSDEGKQEWVTGKNDLQERKAENNSMDSQTERERTGSTEPSTWSSSRSHTAQQQDPDTNQGQTCTDQRSEQQDAALLLCSAPASLLQSPREQKRLSWMKGCIPWCKLSLQNRRKQKGSLRGRGLPRRAAEPSGLPPLCPDALLRSTGRRSVQEVTTVTLEDLPGCSVSTLVQCSQLQSLTLRRCGLKSLEGISHLSQLFYIDVTENDISFVDCENMTSLRVLRLGYNKLTSIHGLRGADNLDVLELSHNNITRIAGLESVRRLQRLSVDHNQLISTKGLRDVYTLLHLNCSHNHLASVEGLENSALLNTMDLRSNSLSEPPSLDNHVLLRELRLDDNSISSLQGLAACWLPLMQQLSVAQNRITGLPSMSDFVSLANLDLQFNCMSELDNVCESLEGCVFLRNVHLTGNPLQQESGWRSSLQKALPGLRAIDDQETDCFLSPPAVQQSSLASDSFLTFCQAQLQQINDLQQQHSRELSEAASSLDAVKSLCRHFTETLKLAEDQRFAHEYGDITASDGQTVLERTADMGSTTEDAQAESSETVPAAAPSGNNSYWTFEKSPTESWLRSLDTITKVRETGPNAVSPNRTTSTHFKMAAQSNHQDLDLRSTAAIAIQQQWRKYRQKYGNISRRPLAGSEGDGANPEPGPFCSNHSVVDQHYAATVIQASWRGSSVRRRLASALAAVTFPSTREDDTFEEVDVDGFVFDEAELEKQWTLQLPEDSFSRHDPVSEPPPSPKFPGPLRQPCHYSHATHGVWRPKQAWVPEEEVGPAGRVSPESPHGKSPASSSVLSGISERSEKILEEWGFTDSHTALQMLKRAQNMKWKQQHKKKHRDPSVRLVLSTNCNNQLVPAEARNRAAPHRYSKGAVCRAEMEAQQESAQQRLHVQPDGGAHSDRFLPELSSDILRGGRVQLVADPVYSERHRASGLRANSSSSAQQHSSYPARISLGHARTDVPSPNQVTAAPSVKQRISFRDNPVQLSGGWGGGKKRNNVHK